MPIPTLGSPVMGPANARITLVEFSDFQCPYCSKAVAQINATLKAYPNDVRLIFKQYPLDSHPAGFDLGGGEPGGACSKVSSGRCTT